VVKGCTSKLKPRILTEKGVTDTFNYLERLFKTDQKPKVTVKQARAMAAAIDPYVGIYENLLKRVNQSRKFNGYDKMNLAKVFEFMIQKN